MPRTTYRRAVTNMVRAALLQVVAPRRAVPETELPDRIRRDIGIGDGPFPQAFRRMKWHDLNM